LTARAATATRDPQQRSASSPVMRSHVGHSLPPRSRMLRQSRLRGQTPLWSRSLIPPSLPPLPFALECPLPPTSTARGLICVLGGDPWRFFCERFTSRALGTSMNCISHLLLGSGWVSYYFSSKPRLAQTSRGNPPHDSLKRSSSTAGLNELGQTD